MVAQSLVETIQHYLQVVHQRGVPVDFAVLYGSVARGEMNDWSDIDLMVVSPLFDPPRRHEDVDQIWIATLDADARIEPVAIGSRQWREDETAGLLSIARREGQIIYPH
ncbi:MAG: nucleotidyltransferase domain-containing protein [Magnetococcales bacterium]|nr:nucleotidyltransferase domain-containing protein [Magnetococcales bacterium]MBF0116835.1 nucleotidyltransferase domain-containing protein [Magnetococcales bacterium]